MLGHACVTFISYQCFADWGLSSTLTLLLPYIVSAINEKMMYIFGVVNVLSIPIGTYTNKPWKH